MRKYLCGFFLLCIFFSIHNNVSAETYRVTTLTDPVLNETACPATEQAPCSLRKAISITNSTRSVGDTILLGVGTYNVFYRYNPQHDISSENNNENGDLDIKSNVIIRGMGSSQTTITLSPRIEGGIAALTTTDRVFDIHTGNSPSIFGVRITNGNALTSNGELGGGGIRINSGATLTLEESEISQSKTILGYGGGILNRGNLIAKNVRLEDNSVSSTRPSDVISFNPAVAGIDSVKTRAFSYPSNGGALANMGSARLENFSISNNRAMRYGGGIYNEGTLTLINGTISENTVQGGQFKDAVLVGHDRFYPLGQGGGIFNRGRLEASYITITTNRVDANGAGISNGASAIADVNPAIAAGNITIRSSIISNNRTFGSPTLASNCYGSFSSQGNNLVDDSTCNGSLNEGYGDSPLEPGAIYLEALRDNGGFVKTQSFAAGSRALNGVNYETSNCPSTDARGVSRPQMGHCDIGAYEENNIYIGYSPTQIQIFGQTAPRTTVERTITVTNNSPILPIQISEMVLNGNEENNFGISSNTCNGNLLGIGGSCRITVQFHPIAGADGALTAQIQARVNDQFVGQPYRLLGIRHNVSSPVIGVISPALITPTPVVTQTPPTPSSKTPVTTTTTASDKIVDPSIEASDDDDKVASDAPPVTETPPTTTSTDTPPPAPRVSIDSLYRPVGPVVTAPGLITFLSSGVFPSTLVPNIYSIDFSNTLVGQSSTSRCITFTNTSETPVVFNGNPIRFSTEGPFYLTESACDGVARCVDHTLNQNEQCSLSLVFRPTTEGRFMENFRNTQESIPAFVISIAGTATLPEEAVQDRNNSSDEGNIQSGLNRDGNGQISISSNSSTDSQGAMGSTSGSGNGSSSNQSGSSNDLGSITDNSDSEGSASSGGGCSLTTLKHSNNNLHSPLTYILTFMLLGLSLFRNKKIQDQSQKIKIKN